MAKTAKDCAGCEVNVCESGGNERFKGTVTRKNVMRNSQPKACAADIPKPGDVVGMMLCGDGALGGSVSSNAEPKIPPSTSATMYPTASRKLPSKLPATRAAMTMACECMIVNVMMTTNDHEECDLTGLKYPPE